MQGSLTNDSTSSPSLTQTNEGKIRELKVNKATDKGNERKGYHGGRERDLKDKQEEPETRIKRKELVKGRRRKCRDEKDSDKRWK